jgi:hypothetical protein
MSRLLFLLVPRAIAHVFLPPLSIHFIGQTFTVRQVVAGTTTFSDCAFVGCQTTGSQEPDDRGGAVYFNNDAGQVGFSGCLFQECKATNRGAAMRIENSFSFSMTGSTGLLCHSYYRYGFFCAYISWAAGSLAVAETASVSCEASETTVKLRCLGYADGGTASVDSLNCTSNRVTAYGSGFFMEQHHDLSLRFCVFSHNERTNCLRSPRTSSAPTFPASCSSATPAGSTPIPARTRGSSASARLSPSRAAPSD